MQGESDTLLGGDALPRHIKARLTFVPRRLTLNKTLQNEGDRHDAERQTNNPKEDYRQPGSKVGERSELRSESEGHTR